MLDVARRRGRERGIENVDYRVLDAERIALPDQAVDAVLCRFGYMVIGRAGDRAGRDPARAAARRAHGARGLGRARAQSVLPPPSRPPRSSPAGHFPPPGPSGSRAVRTWRTRRGSSGLVADAGFDHVRTDEVPVHVPASATSTTTSHIFADTAGPMALVLQGLSDAERATFAASLESSFAPFRTGTGY